MSKTIANQKAREYADRLGVILFNKLPVDFDEQEKKQFEDFVYKKGEFEE